ncbi:hypothetical protein [Corynebacterium aquilae]|uniref:hypothetical protein n=1 Tax=Corynebacterium aquilae TaxID=203263 RepID=UPI000952806B|nr:hypothetical protein [Corynebacterium aquilae]
MKHTSDDGRGLVDERLKEIAADDAFLDALAAGTDPSGGTDPLAGLLLALKHDIDHAPMPAAPTIPGADTADITNTTVMPAINTPTATPKATSEQPTEPARTPGTDNVIDLSSRRRRRGGHFMSGLIGAAAATLFIAGSGVAVYNATPGSALWGANTAIFGDHAAVVELATTLDEADTRNNQGDIEGALELLNKAKALANEMNNQPKAPAAPAPEQPRATVTRTETATDTVTVTAPPPEPENKETPAPSTVTTTVTTTVAPTPQEIDPALPTTTTPTTSLPTSAVRVPDFLDPPTREPEANPIAATTTPTTNPDPAANIDARVEN